MHQKEEQVTEETTSAKGEGLGIVNRPNDTPNNVTEVGERPWPYAWLIIERNNPIVLPIIASQYDQLMSQKIVENFVSGNKTTRSWNISEARHNRMSARITRSCGAFFQDGADFSRVYAQCDAVRKLDR